MLFIKKTNRIHWCSEQETGIEILNWNYNLLIRLVFQQYSFLLIYRPVKAEGNWAMLSGLSRVTPWTAQLTAARQPQLSVTLYRSFSKTGFWQIRYSHQTGEPTFLLLTNTNQRRERKQIKYYGGQTPWSWNKLRFMNWVLFAALEMTAAESRLYKSDLLQTVSPCQPPPIKPQPCWHLQPHWQLPQTLLLLIMDSLACRQLGQMGTQCQNPLYH